MEGRQLWLLGSWTRCEFRQCKYCDITAPSRDSQAHCLRCPAWESLRSDLDLTFLEDLVTYFQRVLKERAEREEKERKRRRVEREEEQKRKKDEGERAKKRKRGQ